MNKLGILNKSIVTIIVGATIIADILALVSMELITNFAEEGVATDMMLTLGLHFLIFFAVVLIIIPRISRYFLNAWEGELGVQFVFVLVVLFITAVIAHFLGIEPIIGAFFSGLVLNRYVMHDSPLYKRIEFVGNNLFIPFFLISIGMLANFRVYIDEPHQLGLLLLMIAVAILGKYLAAGAAKIVFKLSLAEANLVFGMSVSRAASAVAIILIGFNQGIVSEAILNNTVILILATSILSTYVTQRAGKQVLLKENDTISGPEETEQKILVPLANPDNMANLLEFAVLIKQGDKKTPLYPLTVFLQQKEEFRNSINENRERIEKVIASLHSDVKFEIASRIDKNVTRGIVRAAEEIVATAIILGWHEKTTTFQALFGDLLDNVLKKTNRMVLVLKTPSTLKKAQAIRLFVHENAQFEEGFSLWMDTLINLLRRLQVRIYIYTESEYTENAILKYAEMKNSLKYFEVEKDFAGELKGENVNKSQSDLMIFVHSRKNSVWFSRRFSLFLNSCLEKYDTNNMVVIYPEEN